MIKASVNVTVTPSNPELESTLSSAATNAANDRLRSLHPSQYGQLRRLLRQNPREQYHLIEEVVQRVIQEHKRFMREQFGLCIKSHTAYLMI